MEYVLEQLKRCFKKSFINKENEMILCPTNNAFFRLDDVKTELDLTIKILAYCSRTTYKEAEKTYMRLENFKKGKVSKVSKKTLDQENYLLDGINEFLGTGFNWRDMQIIYNRFGNGIRNDELLEFVESGFNMRSLVY